MTQNKRTFTYVGKYELARITEAAEATGCKVKRAPAGQNVPELCHVVVTYPGNSLADQMAAKQAFTRAFVQTSIISAEEGKQ